VTTYRKTDRTIGIRAGETFTVELEGQPGAGYQWEAESVPLLQSQGRAVHPAAALGGKSREQFTFKAGAPGTAVLRFRLKRRWERDAVETAEFHVTVT
jgi:predicted secreted protein